MVKRDFWTQRICDGWKETPIVWLSGVRRSGKTTIATGFSHEETLYLNCDLPSVAQRVENPELFYRNCDRPILIFDEVQQLPDPSRLLKIGADMFPTLQILATGSSTLAATRKFRDTLTGRKRQVHLLPVLWGELEAFENTTLHKRLYHGGLPPALLAPGKSPAFYREWADSFFARDLQKLFGLREPEKFNHLFEYVMRQSGGLWESSKAASALGLSRPTVQAYLRAMEVTHAAYVVRPFFGGGRKELVKMPKVYGFDTGFVSFFRGWDQLRSEDYGCLWEHLVLEWLMSRFSEDTIHYWRDVAGRELDFVMPRGRDGVDAIECKWKPSEFASSSLKVFREYYPNGQNYLVVPMSDPPYRRSFTGLELIVCGPSGIGQ